MMGVRFYLPLHRSSGRPRWRFVVLVCGLLLLSLAAAAQVSDATIIRRLGYPADARLLIIHDDDVGLSHEVNRAAFIALEKGWITSASIMVPCPAFAEAAEFARHHPDLDLGLHLTLTSEWKHYRWGPVSPVPVNSLVDGQGYFPYTVRALAARATHVDVQQELRAQIEEARAAGVNFTHLDTHMGTLLKNPQLYHAYQQVAREYGVPHLTTGSGSPRGRLHGRRGLNLAFDTLVVSKNLQLRPYHSHKKWLQTYERMLETLQPGGVYELIVHLGFNGPELQSITGHQHWGATWRQNDFDLVSNPKFQRFLREQNFVLVTWKDLARAMQLPEEAENR